MNYTRFLYPSAVSLLLASCAGDHNSVVEPASRSMHREQSTVPFASRPQRLQHGVDTAALASLLAAVPPGVRPALRAAFEERPGHAYKVVAGPGNPRFQSLIDAVTPPRSVPVAEAAVTVSNTTDVWSAPARLVLVSGMLSSESRITIQRRAGPHPGDDVILGDADSSVTTLSRALTGLALLRRKDGIVARSDHTVRLTLLSGRLGPRAWTPYLQAKLRELRASARRNVPGIGMARAIEVRMPSR